MLILYHTDICGEKCDTTTDYEVHWSLWSLSTLFSDLYESLNFKRVYLLQDNYVGWVAYHGWLPFIPLAQLPFHFNINMGHILARHGFNQSHFYLKSMFCWNLSYVDALWQLITYAFVAVCGSPHSNGPMDTCPWVSGQGCGYAVIRYWYPYSIGWLINGRAARWIYLQYRYNGHIVFICQTWLS